MRSTKAVDVLAQAWPQFAYLQRRGTAEAIARIATHCQRVRSQLQDQKLYVHAGARVRPLAGGAQLSIDPEGSMYPYSRYLGLKVPI